jgi:hypothetical protein
MSDLVQRLSNGDHSVAVRLAPGRTATALKEQLDRGYVHITFTGTRGGTELGVAVEPGLTDVATADFENETGRVTVVGGLTLDYVRVRCVAAIDLPSLTGVGHLEPLSD